MLIKDSGQAENYTFDLGAVAIHFGIFVLKTAEARPFSPICLIEDHRRFVHDFTSRYTARQRASLNDFYKTYSSVFICIQELMCLFMGLQCLKIHLSTLNIYVALKDESSAADTEEM